LPSGNLRAGDRDYNIFSNTQVAAAKPLNDVIVRAGQSGPGREGAAPVRISDVAKVEDSTADQSEIVRVDGKRGVFLRVLKQPGANTIQVVDSIRAAMPNFRGIPPSVKLSVAFDQSSYIRSAVSVLQHEAVWGGVMAVLVILIFLVSVRATGIIAVAIPLSVMATFILLNATGQTLNVFTLGGLALGIGRLVDDSIVELENIHRHLQFTKNRREAVLAAAQEVAMPILVSTITTIVVFLPVLFLSGVARNLFVPLALTISFALATSFFVSRTVTPLLCLYMLRSHAPGSSGLPASGSVKVALGGFAAALTRVFDRVDEGYAGMLRWVLRHRLMTVSAILLAFGLSMLVKSRIGTEFFPDTDESQFSVSFKAPIGTRVERTEQVSKTIESAVAKHLGAGDRPAARTVISSVGLPLGRSATNSQNTGPHAGQVQVNLVPKTARAMSDVAATEAVRAELRDALPGTQVFMFVGGIVKRILNFGSPAPIDVEILGQDLAAGSEYARQVQGRLRAVADKTGRPWLTDLQITREENYPELDAVRADTVH